MRFSILRIALLLPLRGWAFISEKPLSDLKRLVEAQDQKRLSFGLDIGNPGDESRLAIDGIVFDLTKHAPTSTNDFVKMPGANGTPQLRSLSGGIHTLSVVNDGSFISMAGSNTVKTLKGCWEIIWRDGEPSGSFLCGFEVDQDYKRNDATLPKGIVYITFSAWTSESLKEEQDKKKQVADLATITLKKKREELDKISETNNLIQKALHYYNASNAAEQYSMLPIAKMESVPGPADVIRLEGDLYISTKGTVWTQSQPNSNQIKLGNAQMKPAWTERKKAA